jgi:hypothetical protein
MTNKRTTYVKLSISSPMLVHPTLAFGFLARTFARHATGTIAASFVLSERSPDICAFAPM